jgi:NAD(P)-dependent dehydrogenase (short-subunit alcohol dehydrogenase family)
VLIAARDADRVTAAATAIGEEFGVKAAGHACDVATAGGCASLVDATSRLMGGCDILVNNAGTGSNETIMNAPDEKWQAYWDLHVMAAVRLAREGAGHTEPDPDAAARDDGDPVLQSQIHQLIQFPPSTL